MKTEAKYYTKKGTMIICDLCPNQCRLSEGQIGLCRARKMIDGVLYSMSYANPCAIHVDPVEKKPLHHFYPGSNTLSIGVEGCLLHCKSCQNHTISQAFPNEEPSELYSPEDIVTKAKARHCESISYTYTEPFAFFEYTLETSKLAKENGLKNIIVSSAYVNEAPLMELIPFIDAANIDLKCFSASFYKEFCKGDLDVVLRNIQILNKSHVWLELTNLVIPGYTDDMELISEMCYWLMANGFERVPIHFSRFFPDYKLIDIGPTPIETVKNAVKIAKKSGLKYVYSGNIAEPSDTFCPDCDTSLIKRTGYHVEILPQFNGACPKCNCQIDGLF